MLEEAKGARNATTIRQRKKTQNYTTNHNSNYPYQLLYCRAKSRVKKLFASNMHISISFSCHILMGHRATQKTLCAWDVVSP
jgi:hypothetical protein